MASPMKDSDHFDEDTKVVPDTVPSSVPINVMSSDTSSADDTRKKLCGIRYLPPDEILASMDKGKLSAWKKDELRKRKAAKERLRRMNRRSKHVTSASKHARVYNPPPHVMATMSEEDLKTWRVNARKKRKAKTQREKRRSKSKKEPTAALKTPDDINSSSAAKPAKNKKSQRKFNSTDSNALRESEDGKNLGTKSGLKKSQANQEVDGLQDFLSEIDFCIGQQEFDSEGWIE